MKNFKLFEKCNRRIARRVTLIAVLLAMCIPQAWAWYLPGNLSGSMRDNITANNMNADNKITFFAVPAGTYKLQLTNGSSWSGNSCVKTVSGCTKGTDGTYATITISAAKNVTVEIEDAANWKVKVTATDPCTYIKYGWNGGDWAWSKGMNPYGNGKYACVGQYSGGYDFNYQVSTDEEHYNDGSSNVTLDNGGTAFSKGDWCVFIYDVTSSRENPSLTIQRCSKVTPTNYVYFDNTESNWSDTYIYFMIGRPVNASDPYLATYRMTAVGNTKLYRYIHTSGSWSDADYYAVGGRSSNYDSGNNGWTVVPSNFTHYSAPHTSIYNMENTHYYMISKTSSDNNTAISIAEKGTAYSCLNSLTVGYKYNLNGSDMSSGNTPAQISMVTYSFSNCSTAVANTTQTISANTSGTYTKSQSSAAYRGAVTLTMSSLQSDYVFLGWYEGETRKSSDASYTYYPKANTTVIAKFAYKWNIKGSNAAMGSWSTYNGMTSSETNKYQVTLSLGASTTYDFKVVKRTDYDTSNDVYYGKASTTFTRSTLTSAKNLVTTGGDTYNMHITTDIAGDYTFTYIYDASTSNMKVLVKYPCATANQVLYKFEVKSTKTSGNVCSAGSTLTDLTSEVELSSLAGGTLKANASNASKLTFASGGVITWSESSTSTYLRIDLDCPLQTNDLIRFTNTASKAGNNVYVRHTSNTTETNQFTLDGLSTDAIVEIPDAFNGKSTLWLVRGASNGAQIKYVEILRPYVVTLNAHDGTCSASKIKTMAGNVVLPHAFKDGYRFNGWYTDASGGTKKDDYYTVNSTITLHAQYTSGCPTSGKVFSLAMESSRKPRSMVYPPKAGTMDLIPYATMTYGAAFAGNTNSTSNYGGVTNAGVVQLNNANAYIKIDLDCALDEGDTIYVVSNTSSSNQYYLTAGSTRASTYTTSGTSTKTHSYIVTGSEGFSKTLYIWEGSSSVVVSDVLIKRPAKYTVSYNNGGGSGSMSSHSVVKGADQALTANTFTKNGYTFSCWHANVAVKVGGSTISAGDDIANSATLQDISSDVTLTAQWTAKNYTIGLNANGGSDGSANVSLTYNSASHAAITNPTKSGYTFAGWYSGEGGTGNLVIDVNGVLQANVTSYTGAGGIWTKESGTTLYAKWEENCYSFTPSGDNGTIAVGNTVSGSTGGTMKVATAKIVKTAANRLKFDHDDATDGSVLVTLNNYMQAGTIISLSIYNPDDKKTRGLILKDKNGTTVSTCTHGTAGVKHYLYTVVADDGLEGEYRFVLNRSQSAELVALNVAYCGADRYTVTYKANGGTGDDVTNDSETTISSNTFTAPATKAFVGWNTKSDGTGTPYAVGDAVDDNLTLYAQWRYKVMYIVGSASESSDIRTVLDTYYAVTERVATTDTYDASIYSSYALIVISESVAGDKAKDSGKEITEIKKLNKPILNLKAFIYGADGDASKRWQWGAPNAGKKPKCIYVKNDTYANLTSHPIFADLTPDGSDSIQILKTPLTTKPIQPIGSFVSGKEGYTLALVPNKSSESGTAIHEMTAAQRSSATGETITSKYLLISIQEGELSNLSDGGKTLIKNAANYLVTGSQWVPQYKITHSAASDGSYTIQVGAGSATDDDTMSAAGTTITLDDDPDSGFELDSWTVTGDVSGDNITVTSNQFIMPAEAVTVAATFVEDSYTISFDGNGADGGTEVDDVTGIDSGNDANLPENTWEKTEHTFAGWKTNVALTYVEKGGEDEINVAADGIVPNEATIKNVTSNITLTAQWQVNEYDVHFWVGIDVSVEGRFSTYEYGEEKVLPTTVLRSGYLFDGWYTNSSLTGDPVTQMPADATGEQDYYPKWKALSAKCLYITGEVIDAYNDVAADPGYYMHNGVKYVFGEGYDDDEDALVLPAAAERSYVYLDLNFGEVKEVQLHISDIADKNTAEKGISWGFVDDDDDIASVVLTNLDNISDHEFSFRPTGSNMQYFVFKSHGTTLTIDNICVYYEAATYSVTYSKGSASGTAPVDGTAYGYLDLVTVADTVGCNFSYSGYTFRGWSVGGNFYSVGDQFAITGNTTLNAVWESNSGGGGDCEYKYWFRVASDAPEAVYEAGEAQNTTFFTTTLGGSSGGSDWAKSWEIDGVTYSVTKRASNASNICSFTVPSEKTATFYLLAKGSTGYTLSVKKSGDTETEYSGASVASDPSKVTVSDLGPGTYTVVSKNGANAGNIGVGFMIVKLCSGGGADANFNIEFKDGTAVAPASHDKWPDDITGVPTGKKVSVEDPITIGYAFLGWYKDAACSVGKEVMVDTLAITKDTIIYAKWVENVKTFTGGASTTAWETAGNWDAAGVPNSAYPYCYSQIYIKAPAEMAKNTKEHVGRVDIVNDGSSNTGKLTINSGAMLIVYDKVNRVENWGTQTRMATIAEDIYIGSERDDSALSWRENGALNGALIMGDYDREEQADSATVQFASLAYTKSSWTTSETSWGERDVNQYIGIPFAHTQVSDYKPYDIYTYTNVYLYSHDRWNNSWEPMSKNQDMYEFTGYDLICFSIAPDEYTNPKPIFDLKGELASTEDQRIHLRGYEGWYGAEENESMLANSWTAPIHISSFEVSDFENAEATIYMFNAGTAAEYDGNMEWASSYSTYPGQYTAIPINDLKLHPYYYTGYRTIPSMQSFSIITLDNDGNSLTKHDLSYLTMDYKRLVYDPAVEAVGVLTETMHAPRRVPTMEESPLAIMLHVHGVESGLGDRIRLLEREDFSFGRDNGWETSKLLGIIEAPSLYAVTEVGDQATVAVPDVEGLALTFQAGEYDNVYTFNFEYDEIEEPLYLLDRKTGIYTRVLTGNTYSFVTTDKNFNERFMLTRNYQMPEVATGLENTNADSSLNERVQKVLINDMIYILRDGHIYDATGKMLK